MIDFLEEAISQPDEYKLHQEIVDLLKDKTKEKLVTCIYNHFDHAIENLNVQKEYLNLENLFK